jgi:multisubunit Na+/H+ antiporter MnhF subunit
VRRTNEALGAVLLLGLTTMLAGCQSPTEPDDVIAVDDFVEASVTPDPAEASTSTGRTYRVVRGNNQPDDILEYDWKTTFTIAILVNETANDDDLDLAFPLDVTAATVKAQQASGGIVTPPGGGELEYSDFTITSSSGSRFAAANATNTITFDVWYDFPNLRREALMTVSVAMKDADGRTFTKIKEVRVAP